MDASPTPGTGLVAGLVRLRAGVIEMAFDKGVRAIIEAPAEVNLVDGRVVALNAGVLTAHVPEEGRGFEVDTPSVRITDLGTEFGLVAKRTGAVDVHVLDGWVATSFASPNRAKPRRVEVLERNKAMRFNERTGTMRKIAVDADRFARSWDEVLYKPRLEGAAKFLPSMPVSLVPGAFESSEHVCVFLERTDVALPRTVAVNIADPGYYTRFQNLSATLAPDVKVDSYLIHWDPTESAGGCVQTTARLAFRRPILGVIVNSRELSATDALYGNPDTIYGKKGSTRHLESAQETCYDVLRLDPDRMALKVDFRTSSSIDQLRVLVASVPAEERQVSAPVSEDKPSDTNVAID